MVFIVTATLVEVLMKRTPSGSPERTPSVHTPVHRASRRLLGLNPEYAPLQDAASTSQLPQAMSNTNPTPVTLQNTKQPECFHGDLFEDVEDWLDQYERAARYNQWDAQQKLSNVYYSLQDSARTWFQNHEANIPTWSDFRTQLLDTFRSGDRRDKALRMLELRFQKPNETVAMFAEDLTRLFHRADPDMSEAKKLRHLMRGVKEQLFAGLVRNPPTTVREFVKDATAIERALHERYRQYDRPTNGASTSVATLAATDATSLRELIREVVREELQLLTSNKTMSAVTVTDVVREQLRHPLSPPQQTHDTCSVNHIAAAPFPYQEPVPLSYSNDVPEPYQEPRSVTYAEVVRRPPPNRTAPGIQDTRFSRRPQWVPPRRPQQRRTDMWRSDDRRPLCFYCGQPGHVYRYCRYREGGYTFPPAANRCHLVDNVNTEDRSPPTPADSLSFRPRSPSPVRYSSPNRRGSGEADRRRSPSPRRGN